ncbi:MAG: hypothetical protein ACOX3Q_04905 [Clostridia bacterium]|jgi:hypothetical protein|nr:hypothetical protein [Clostridiaceae bacterium]
MGFWLKQKQKKYKDTYIIAVKDYSPEKIEALISGEEYMPNRENDCIKRLFSEIIDVSDVNSAKDLRYFIRRHGVNRNLVIYHWDGLRSRGYTVMLVRYKGLPIIEDICDGDKVVYLARPMGIR